MIAIFLFYNKAMGKQLKYTFNEQFKHCNVITFDGDIYLLSEMQSKGILYRKINAKSITSLLKNLKIIPELFAMITVFVDKNKDNNKWFPLLIRSCNEYCRLISKVDIGFTLNPINLYKKLLKYKDKRNYKIIHAWSRNNGRLIGRRWVIEQ